MIGWHVGLENGKILVLEAKTPIESVTLQFCSSAFDGRAYMYDYIPLFCVDAITYACCNTNAGLNHFCLLKKPLMTTKSTNASYKTPWIGFLHHTLYCCNEIQLSAIIMWFNIVRYYINNSRKWGRTSIRYWIHKRQPIAHPNRWAMGCILWIFGRKSSAL